MKTTTIFNGKAQIVLNIEPGHTPSLKEVNFNLEMPVLGSLDQDMYLKNGVPTGAGVKVLTNCFVQGLAGNIKAAAVNGMWKQQEHIDYIIAELARAVTAETDVKPGENYFHERK